MRARVHRDVGDGNMSGSGRLAKTIRFGRTWKFIRTISPLYCTDSRRIQKSKNAIRRRAISEKTRPADRRAERLNSNANQ